MLFSVKIFTSVFASSFFRWMDFLPLKDVSHAVVTLNILLLCCCCLSVLLQLLLPHFSPWVLYQVGPVFQCSSLLGDSLHEHTLTHSITPELKKGGSYVMEVVGFQALWSFSFEKDRSQAIWLTGRLAAPLISSAISFWLFRFISWQGLLPSFRRLELEKCSCLQGHLEAHVYFSDPGSQISTVSVVLLLTDYVT